MIDSASLKLLEEKKKLFNFCELEEDLDKSYENYVKLDNEKSRTEVFLAIRKMAFAVLSVGKHWLKYDLDHENTSYEYASYLFERIILGTFIPKGRTKFPWQHYIRMNLRHIVITKRTDNNWHELVDDVQYLIDEYSDVRTYTEEENPHVRVTRKNLAFKLYNSIRMFYTVEEMKRLYPIAVEYIDRDFGSYKNRNLPNDIKEFACIMIALSKRVVMNDNINMTKVNFRGDFKKVLSSSVRSSVFLSTIVNSDFFPKELLLSLDLESLYRIVYILGGETIRIPTQRELDTLLGAVVTVSKAMMEGKDPFSIVGESKHDYDLVFSRHISIQSYVSKILESYDLFKEDSSSEPLVNILLKSIKSIETLFGEITKNSDYASPEMLLKSYGEMSSSFTKFTDSLVKVSTILKEDKKESPC